MERAAEVFVTEKDWTLPVKVVREVEFPGRFVGVKETRTSIEDIVTEEVEETRSFFSDTFKESSTKEYVTGSVYAVLL